VAPPSRHENLAAPLTYIKREWRVLEKQLLIAQAMLTVDSARPAMEIQDRIRRIASNHKFDSCRPNPIIDVT